MRERTHDETMLSVTELIPPHPYDGQAQVQRRKLLALLLASPVLAASWAPSMVQGAAGAGTAATAAEKFMTLSTFATGRSKLDPELGA